jgi:hypothetical protein
MAFTGKIIGYDPGGNDNHGVASLIIDDGLPIKLSFATVRNAQAALEWFTIDEMPLAAGIDTLTVLSMSDSGQMKVRAMFVILCMFLLCWQLPVYASLVTIDFDDLDTSSGPVEVINQYQYQGVIFNNLYVNDISSQPPGSYTYPNAGIIDNEAPYSLSVSAEFTNTVDFVQADFSDWDIGTQLIRITAYDQYDNVLDSVTVVTPSQRYATVGISESGIRTVIFETDSDGTIMDNLTFNTVPIPGALLLFGTGIVGLFGLQLGNRKKK